MRKSHPWSPAYYDTFNTNTAVIAHAAIEEKMRAISGATRPSVSQVLLLPGMWSRYMQTAAFDVLAERFGITVESGSETN
jgi:hypothetical protein